MELEAIQHALRDAGLDGWLFCDFHHRDPMAYRILGLDESSNTSRRWFYFVPAQGEPINFRFLLRAGLPSRSLSCGL